MTENSTAQSTTASPAAQTAPPAASPQTESPSSQASGTPTAGQGAETPRGSDGKFQRRPLPEAWRDKPDRFAQERADLAAKAPAPPVPVESTAKPAAPAPDATAPRAPKDGNFVPQPRFDAVIAERNTLRQRAEAAERELAQFRAQSNQRQSAPPAQQPQQGVPDEVARFLGIAPEETPPQLAQMFQQVPQLQQQVAQMQAEREAQQAQHQLAQEADHAMRALVQQGVPEQIAKVAIRNGMGYIRDDDQLQVIDAAALWLQRHRDVLSWGEPAQPPAPARQPLAAPPVPAPAPAGVQNAPVKPQRGAPWQDKIAYLNSIIGR